jgi:hypothetical protein
MELPSTLGMLNGAHREAIVVGDDVVPRVMAVVWGGVTGPATSPSSLKPARAAVASIRTTDSRADVSGFLIHIMTPPTEIV